MTRARFILAGALVALALVSTFAPAPLARSAEAQAGGPPCDAIQFAYEQCLANAPDPDRCAQLQEVLLSCSTGSGSSGSDGSSDPSFDGR